ncbi:uncharacterized protein [Misgurnus anguillicaudatus]|uniref:uncharacterized protein isoform X3 n=1 Tax=Misgurnus anguillicaudatus TaxID=75329 RepID=UPI003CCF90B2
MKMCLQSCALMSILLMVADGFTVKGPSGLLVVPLGGSVVLPCSVDSFLPLKDLEVEWRRSDSQTIIHLYQDEDIRPEAQHQDYHDRAHFFTENIKHGNFSLLLNNLTAEDEGQYTCKVYSGQESGETVVEISLKDFGFTGLHIMVLIFCITACGSAVIICSLIYRSTTDSVLHLQMLLVFCPNITMFFAFIFWGVSEGSLNETIFCCALYFLRPLMLLWAAPYINDLKDNIKTWIQIDSYETEYIVFSAILYSVLYQSAWGKRLSFAGFEGIMILILFGVVLLFFLFYFIHMFARISGKLPEHIITIFNVLSKAIFDVLPSLQFILLFYMFGSAGGGFFIVAILPVITTTTRNDWNLICGQKMGCSPLVRRSVWFTLMLLVTGIIMYFYTLALENEKDRVGWVCVIGFLQVLWTVWNCLWSFKDWDFTRTITVYVFGSVGVVLINAVALMTELILKTVNGEAPVGDLRIVIFSSEIVFTASALMILISAPWIKKDLQCCQVPVTTGTTLVPSSSLSPATTGTTLDPSTALVSGSAGSSLVSSSALVSVPALVFGSAGSSLNSGSIGSSPV